MVKMFEHDWHVLKKNRTGQTNIQLNTTCRNLYNIIELKSESSSLNGSADDNDEN
jgi:hypothetical protein